MKIKIEIGVEVTLKTLSVKAGIRYWEDSDINGIKDTENGDNIPCKIGDLWCPEIDIDTGIILNWKKGTIANIHYKVADECGWELKNEIGKIIMYCDNDYVPRTLSPKEEGYGDYIIMDIDENGKIDKWVFVFEDFLECDFSYQIK